MTVQQYGWPYMQKELSAPQKPRSYKMARAVSALMLREMSTTYGRTNFGYLWAILEPVAGIVLLTFVFSFALRSPPLGTNFALFYASGILPFLAYTELSNKVATSLRFSKVLLTFPAVTYVDALLGRILLNAITQVMVIVVVLSALLSMYRIDVILDYPAILLSIAMAITLGVSVGVLNCFILSMFPVWERIWAILNRPMFFVSGIFFLFEDTPSNFSAIMWYNPLIHITGQMRRGIYQTYPGDYISPLYVFSLSGLFLAVGMVFLSRYHRKILNE